ncbi:MAG: FAD binding domain-containing protein [Caulobacterales bacterium]
MKPPPFDYVAPATLEAALETLAQYGDDAQPLAGGQSLAAMLALRVARPSVLVDLNRIPELTGIDDAADGLRVGAMTRQVAVLNSEKVRARLPSLAAATSLVGHFQTRNRGTIGGSVSLADPAAENPAFALAMNAEMELRNAKGSRKVAAVNFFDGPYTTARQGDELLTSITYRPSPGARIGVDEIARRPGDFAMTGFVARLNVKDGKIDEAGFAWFGMASQPLRAPSAEASLKGVALKDIDIRAVAHAAVDDTDPNDDHHASAEYRKKAGRVLAERVLTKLLMSEAA